MIKKNIANYITFIRILIGVVIIFIEPQRYMFYILYFLGGISDIVDGYVARRFKTASEKGAKLDSIADFIFITIIFIKVLPIYLYIIDFTQAIVIISIIAIRLIAYFIGWHRFRKIIAFHTISNKITGGILFVSPLFLGQGLHMYILLIYFSGLYAAIEELILVFKIIEYNPNIKSLFYERGEKCQ